jgi:tetratricopeptide (TPR) repeat protein
MNPQQWQRVNEIVNDCLETDPPGRKARAAAACGDDPTLLSEVESLLTAFEKADDFMETSALESEPRKLLAGQRVGNYELRELIGEGGMGAVYLAVRASDFQKKVAIKLVKRGMDTDAILRRFRHERQILAGLDHPNIARLLDGGATEDGRPYLVMEYIEGTPITDYCDEHALPVRRRLELFRSICAAVQYAHQNLIVHRDLKPGNILVTVDGTPKLLDFGIAKLLEPDRDATSTVLRMMTPECASPEQVRGENVTTASDVYALGVLLYQLLTGARPYKLTTSTPEELTRVVCETEPARPSTVRPALSGDLDNIVLKAIQKDPARRYISVEQFSEDVRRHLVGLPVIARKDTFVYRASKFVRRHKTGTLAAAALALSLVAGMAATLWEAHVARTERALAQARFDDVRKLANSLLFELHDAIAPIPGTTAARELVVRRATEFLDRLAADAGDDKVLRRELATAYYRLGSVQGGGGRSNLGHTGAAIQSYQKAARLMESVANGGSIQDRHWLAAVYDELSSLAPGPEGDEYARKALAVRTAMAPLLPPVKAGDELAFSDYTLGMRATLRGDFPGALDNYRKALSRWEAVYKAQPSDRATGYTVALVHKRIGALLGEMNRPKESLEHYRQAQAIEAPLLILDSQNARRRLDATYTDSDIAFLLWTLGDKRGALDNYRRALAVREELATADPKDQRVQWSLASTCTRLGNLLWETGDHAGSIAAHQKALSVREAMLAANQDHDGTELGMVYSCYRLGRAHRWMAEHAGSASAARQLQLWRAARDYFARAKQIADKLKSTTNLQKATNWGTAGVPDSAESVQIASALPGELQACEAGVARVGGK